MIKFSVSWQVNHSSPCCVPISTTLHEPMKVNSKACTDVTVDKTLCIVATDTIIVYYAATLLYYISEAAILTCYA